MAHVLKWPKGNNKGVLVFTHKEYTRMNLLAVGPTISRVKRFIKFKDRIELARQAMDPFYFKRQFEKLKEKYVIGMHIGWYMENVEFSHYLDFALVPDTNLPKLDPTIPRSNLVSRRFIPDLFHPSDTEGKFWDIINVSRNTHSKKLKEFMKAIRKIYDQGHKFRVLLVTPKSLNENPQKHYMELMDDYQAMFDEDERDRFTILRLSDDTKFPGISQSTIAYFYRSSRVFSLFSDIEGGPKVISEALGSGLRIVTYKGLRGGGNDFLNEKNSMQFESYDKAHETLIKAVESPLLSKAEIEENRKLVMAEHTVPQLADFLKGVFEKLNEPFDGTLDDVEYLHQKLPAHTFRGMTWVKPRNANSDIFTREELDLFIKHALTPRN